MTVTLTVAGRGDFTNAIVLIYAMYGDLIIKKCAGPAVWKCSTHISCDGAVLCLKYIP